MNKTTQEIDVKGTDKKLVVDSQYYSVMSSISWRVNDHGRPIATVNPGRLIMALEFLLKKEKEVDHIDRNPFNNTTKNLRLATKSENNHNKGITKQNTSGYKGVTYDRSNKKWIARVRAGTKRIHCGHFKTKEEAAMAYNQALAGLTNIAEDFKVYNKL